MNAVCLVIDRLHCGYLGCYGNAWVGTPGLDRLAAESFVLDGAYIDSPTLESLYRSYWSGEHALAALSPAWGEGQGDGQALPQRLSAAGISTTLVSDAVEVARHPVASRFNQCIELPTDWPSRAAADLEDTSAARFFASALDALRDARPPFLLWLHSQGMAGPWDAPRELRERYAAEEDPLPADFVRPPAMRLPADPDPDELLGIRQAYAAQVSVLDSCVEAFVSGLRESQRKTDTLFVLLSARGYPLGVHGCVGSPAGETEALYGELTSIPWLLRFPDGIGAADRSSALVQPPDLFGTLLEWFGCGQSGSLAPCGQLALQAGVPLAERADHTRQLAERVGHTSMLPLVRGDTRALRDRAAIVSATGQRALRTPAWYARFVDAETAELYLKPDDRWEVNDLSRRCPEVVEAMRRAATGEQSKLDDILVHGMH